VSGSTSGRSPTATVAAARASAVDASSRTGVKSMPSGSSRADAPSPEISIRAPPSAIEARSDAITSAAPRRGENEAPMDPWRPLATMTVASMGAAPPTRARKVSARESCRIAAPTESMAFAAASIASVSVCAVRRWRGATKGSTSMSTIETYASARSLPQASSSATERSRPDVKSGGPVTARVPKASRSMRSWRPSRWPMVTSAGMPAGSSSGGTGLSGS
jgi:hypothetical protein